MRKLAQPRHDGTRPPELLAIHAGIPATLPDKIAKSLVAGGDPPAG